MKSRKISIIKDLLLRVFTGKRPSPAASITVEASLVLPLFIFFFINILGAFDILRLQCDMEAALHQTGSQIMEQAAYADMLTGNEKSKGASYAEGALTSGLAAKKVKAYLGEDYLKNSCIRGGAGGISFLQTAFRSDGDIIDIVASYKVHPLIGIAGFTDFTVESRFYGHAFTGYDPTGGHGNDESKKEEYVYITENGSVYHRNINCSHLKVSVQSCPKSNIGNKRSSDGSKYYPCEYCGKKAGGTVYITNYGNRYHSTNKCSAINRNVKTVPLSEVGGRRACKECG
ncbi:TadE family protein [Butyrivibrio sp. WCD3002]|uniref:TadE family protein n=1 Tax=Butyrivibrio sp. WCD3002 TaxID=1280676 RepID=UPI00040ED3AA|nr:TadE family protein [Butyrivibrio sp. WCD3002]